MPKVKNVFKWVNWVENEIYPWGGYTPTSNTIVYLPLNWTLDRYWTSSWTVEIWSDTPYEDIYWNMQWIRFKWNSNSYVKINSVPVMNTDFTLNFWALLYSNTDGMFVERWQSDATNRLLHYIIRGTTKVDLWFYSNDCAWNTNTSNWIWYNFCATYNATTKEMKTYINWTIDWTRTWSWTPDFWSGPLYLWWKHSYSTWNNVNWTMSKFIWEDKVWTLDEVLNHFNKTKKNYWF